MATEEKKLWAVELLQQKHKACGRLPKKDDFDVVTLSRIKAFLGPWPRALEAAGLKSPKASADKNKRKRAASAKGRRITALRTLEKSKEEQHQQTRQSEVE